VHKPHRHARDDLQRLLHPPPADDLGGERLGLVEEVHQSRLELVGQEVADGSDIEDRRRPLIETRAEDIEQSLSFSRLRGADHDDAFVVPGMSRPGHGNHVRREARVTRPRQS